jgi:hypothetical protein
MKPLEKMVWMCVVFGLLFVEFKAIRVDRAQSESDQKKTRMKEAERFESIAQDLTNGFDATMKRSDAIMAKTREALEAAQFVSGGRTFPTALISR